MTTDNDRAKLVQAGDVIALWLEEITRKHCDDAEDQEQVQAAIGRWKEAVAGAKVEDRNEPTGFSKRDLDAIHEAWKHPDDRD